MTSHTVVALYKFVALEDYKEIQPRLLKFCQNHDIKGTILLAKEGINGTISGKQHNIDKLFTFKDKPNAYLKLNLNLNLNINLKLNLTKNLSYN